jgi:hypothetical protein
VGGGVKRTPQVRRLGDLGAVWRGIDAACQHGGSLLLIWAGATAPQQQHNTTDEKHVRKIRSRLGSGCGRL